LDDCDANGNLVPETADEGNPDASDDSSKESESQGVLLVLRALRRFHHLHATEGGHHDSKEEQAKNTGVDE